MGHSRRQHVYERAQMPAPSDEGKQGGWKRLVEEKARELEQVVGDAAELVDRYIAAGVLEKAVWTGTFQRVRGAAVLLSVHRLRLCFFRTLNECTTA